MTNDVACSVDSTFSPLQSFFLSAAAAAAAAAASSAFSIEM